MSKSLESLSDVKRLLALRRFLMGTHYYCRREVSGPEKRVSQRSEVARAGRIPVLVVSSQRIRFV
jgi:hypothetical protein